MALLSGVSTFLDKLLFSTLAVAAAAAVGALAAAVQSEPPLLQLRVTVQLLKAQTDIGDGEQQQQQQQQLVTTAAGFSCVCAHPTSAEVEAAAAQLPLAVVSLLNATPRTSLTPSVRLWRRAAAGDGAPSVGGSRGLAGGGDGRAASNRARAGQMEVLLTCSRAMAVQDALSAAVRRAYRGAISGADLRPLFSGGAARRLAASFSPAAYAAAVGSAGDLVADVAAAGAWLAGLAALPASQVVAAGPLYFEAGGPLAALVPLAAGLVRCVPMAEVTTKHGSTRMVDDQARMRMLTHHIPPHHPSILPVASTRSCCHAACASAPRPAPNSRRWSP
jgi:hypothetical protein